MGKKSRKSKSSKKSSGGGGPSGIAAGFRQFAEQERMRNVAESFAAMDDLERYPLSGQKAILRNALMFIGTDCDKNDADPAGDGDQTPIATRKQADKAREIYSIGGDIHQHAVEGAFTDFGMNAMIGNVGDIREKIQTSAKSIEEKQDEPLLPWYCSTESRNEMRTLLETRDTSMRLSPLLLIVSAGKNVAGQPHMDHQGTAKVLLKSGANPYAKDVLGKTVAHYGAGAMATSMTMDVVDMCVHAAKSAHLFGKEVELHSLKAMHMNGLRGIVGGFDPDAGRRVVFLLEEKKEVLIRPVNLRRVDGENEPYQMLLDVQDRMGSVSLLEVVMQDRTDVAKLLLRHNTSIHTKDMDGMSPVKLTTMGGHLRSAGVCRMINDVTRREAKESKENRRKAIMRTCANVDCLKDLDEGKAKRCTGCKNAFYCNRECQLAHWNNGHKVECKRIRSEADGVKLNRPTGQFAFGASISMVSGRAYDKGSYRVPDGAKPGDRFVVKVQGGGEMTPIMVYDETRTCDFVIAPGQPGFKEVLAEIKKEMAWDGRKTFMKASFDDSGNCTIYPSTAGVKAKYTW